LLEQRAQTKDKTELTRLTTQAIGELEKSLSSGCLQEFAHFNLGWLLLEIDEPTRAIPHFLATVQEAPHRGGAYFGLGLALRASGNEAAAVRAFALEWINDPIAFTGPLWEWPDFALLRPQVVRTADILIAEIAGQNPTARYVRELWSWWENGATPPTDGYNAETQSFAQILAALAQKKPSPVTPTSYHWAMLLDAWQQPPEHHAFAALTMRDEPFTAALVHRATRHPFPQVHGFLATGLEDEGALLSLSRFSRLGYGVLALHPDKYGLVLTNLYVMHQNRIVATYASGLFPPKGWLPARELLTRLPVLPAKP
jgi:hypothetical protein